MKIEITDSLFERYRQLIKEKYYSDDVAEHVQRLIELELRKACVPGYEMDGLTGAKSRFQLEYDLNRITWGSGWDDRSIFRSKYLCLDIDNFKSYIDVHGLTAGDEVLVEIANRLRGKYPDANVYRIGGDEFVVELGDLPFMPLQLDHDVNLKYSIVDVAVQRNDQRHHANSVIMFNLDKGIVEASEQVTNIECKYPDNI